MRWVFRVLPVLLIVGLVGAIVRARSLPSARTLERELVIDAPAAEVYARIARIRAWEGWYVPPDLGTFEGPEVGAGGTLVVTEEDAPPRRVQIVSTSSVTLEVVYTFPDTEQLPYDIVGRFQLEPVGEGQARVRSRQRLEARSGDGAWMAQTGERWFLALLADRFVGSILERELHNLKAAVEGRPPPSRPGWEPKGSGETPQ